MKTFNSKLFQLMTLQAKTPEADEKRKEDIVKLLSIDEAATAIDPELGLSHTAAYKRSYAKDSKGTDLLEEVNLIRIATIHGCHPVIEHFIKKTKLNINELENSSLWFAVRENNVDTVKFLLELGANPNNKTNNDVYPNPLHLAVCNTNSGEIIKLLLLNQALPNTKNDKGKTPMDLTDNEAYKKMLTAAVHLKIASDAYDSFLQGTAEDNTPLSGSKNFFKVKTRLDTAFREDFDFTVEYLAKIAEEINKYCQGIGSYNAYLLKPQLLKLGLKALKEFFKLSIGIDQDHLKTIQKLIVHLNGYEVGNQALDDHEAVFLSEKEKSSVLKQLEKGSTMEISKATYEKYKQSQTKLIGEVGSSPVFSSDSSEVKQPAEVVDSSQEQQLNANLNM